MHPTSLLKIAKVVKVFPVISHSQCWISSFAGYF